MSDIKRVQFLIPRIQDVQNIDVVLISSAKSAEKSVRKCSLEIQLVISEVYYFIFYYKHYITLHYFILDYILYLYL